MVEKETKMESRDECRGLLFSIIESRLEEIEQAPTWSYAFSMYAGAGCVLQYCKLAGIISSEEYQEGERKVRQVLDQAIKRGIWER